MESLYLLIGAGIGLYYINSQANGVVDKVGDLLGREDVGSKTIGQICNNNIQCMADGYTPGVGSSPFDQIGCCSGVCRFKRNGGGGIYWCPQDQPQLPEPNAEKQVLEILNRREGVPKIDLCDNDTKEIGSSCSTTPECSYNGIPCEKPAGGINSHVRCHPVRKKCEFLKKQSSGIGADTYWYPEECHKTGFFGSTAGSCTDISPEEEVYNKWKKEKNKETQKIVDEQREQEKDKSKKRTYYV